MQIIIVFLWLKTDGGTTRPTRLKTRTRIGQRKGGAREQGEMINDHHLLRSHLTLSLTTYGTPTTPWDFTFPHLNNNIALWEGQKRSIQHIQIKHNPKPT